MFAKMNVRGAQLTARPTISSSGAWSVPSCSRLSINSRSRRLTAFAASDSEAVNESSSATTTTDADGKIVKEYQRFGMKVIESNESLKGPENEPDFWENPQFEAFGQFVERWFLPSLVILGIVCGAIGAGSYNEGATDYLKTPTGPDSPTLIIPAAAVSQPPASAPPL